MSDNQSQAHRAAAVLADPSQRRDLRARLEAGGTWDSLCELLSQAQGQEPLRYLGMLDSYLVEHVGSVWRTRRDSPSHRLTKGCPAPLRPRSDEVLNMLISTVSDPGEWPSPEGRPPPREIDGGTEGMSGEADEHRTRND